MSEMIRLTKIGGVLIGTSAAIAGFAVNRSGAKPDRPAAGFALVELFTSEGCSSCPPADDVLADLLRASKGQPVYALAFHVDYWNDLGWADRFSDKAYSDRQRQYADALKLDSVYTPQAIVNGTAEFVGSRREQLKAAVADAVAAPSTGSLVATAKSTDGTVAVEVSATDVAAGTLVNVAIVENGLVSTVTRGENRDHTLSHEHVVRSFRSMSLGADGHLAVTLPVAHDIQLLKASIIIYAQRPSDLRVLAAAEIGMPHR